MDKQEAIKKIAEYLQECYGDPLIDLQFRLDGREIPWLARAENLIEELNELGYRLVPELPNEKELREKLKAHGDICFQAGIKEVVDWIKNHQLVAPEDSSITRFEPFYQIEQTELKEWNIDVS